MSPAVPGGTESPSQPLLPFFCQLSKSSQPHSLSQLLLWTQPDSPVLSRWGVPAGVRWPWPVSFGPVAVAASHTPSDNPHLTTSALLVCSHVSSTTRLKMGSLFSAPHLPLDSKEIQYSVGCELGFLRGSQPSSSKGGS